MFLVLSCSQIAGPTGDTGSLSIDIGESIAMSTHGSEFPQATTYFLYGDGPAGETFTSINDGTSTTVEALRTGEWTIVVEGVDESDAVVLEGESTVEVVAMSEIALELTLHPVVGEGGLSLEVLWDDERTIDPSVRVEIQAIENGHTDVAEYEQDSGAVLHSWDELETGYYRVSVELRDGDVTVAGSTDTVRVVNGRTTSFSSQLKELNKVGKPVEIVSNRFSFGWDEPEGTRPDRYRLYYRARGSYEWTLLNSIDGSRARRFTVTDDMLAFGSYEFAVSSVSGDDESPLHTSMSDDADPVTGWYVQWSAP